MRHVLWHLLAGTRGGPMRSRILQAIDERPGNTNQLAERLDVDYKTMQHHLRILEKHNALHIVKPGSYGATYHLSEELLAHREELERIWEKTGNNPEKPS